MTTSGAERFGGVAQLRKGPEPTPGSVGERVRAYTLRLTTTLANQFDEDVLAVRKRCGKKIDKSEVMRELVELLRDDPTVMDHVVSRLKD